LHSKEPSGSEKNPGFFSPNREILEFRSAMTEEFSLFSLQKTSLCIIFSSKIVEKDISVLSLIRKLRLLLTPQDKFRLVALTIMTILGALSELLAVSSLMPVVAVITRPELFQQNRYLKVIYDLIRPESDAKFIFFLSAAVVLFYLLKNAYMLLLIQLQTRFIYRKNTELSSRLFQRYLDAPYAFHQSHNSGTLLSSLEQMNLLPNGLLLPLMLTVTETMVVLALTGLLLCFAPMTTLCAAALVGLLGLLTYLPLKKRSSFLGERRLSLNRLLYQVKTKSFGAIKEIKVANLEPVMGNEFKQLQVADNRISTKIYVVGQLPRLAIETTIILLSLGLLSGLVAFDVASGSVILTLAMLGAAMYRMVPSITRLHYNCIIIRQTMPVFDHIFEELTTIPQCPATPPNAPELSFHDALEIRHITFGYHPDRPTLKDFSLTVHPGESVALTGVTGCGKSTLADLILGLHSPQSGAILCDGVSIAQNLPSWQRKIGYVPQDIYLFDGPLKENIAFGVPAWEIDDDRVRRCLKLAQAEDFVNAFPHGLEENLGERGVRLSGGQKQRLGIARALYRNPELLILDEATSALDDRTERAFADALKSLAGKVTILTIAHRKTTIESCQRQVSLGENQSQK